MPERDVILNFVANTNAAQNAVDRLNRFNRSSASQFERAWKDANGRANSSTRSFLRETSRQWESYHRTNNRLFSSFFRSVDIGFRGMERVASRTVSAMVRTFRRGASVIRSAFSLPGLLLGGAIAGGIQRAIAATFEQQRQQAIFQATRQNAAQREQLLRFVREQEGGLFTRQQVFGAVVAGRRIEDVSQLQRLIMALRGAAASEGDLALAVTAVQRAMFEGEAELSERFGLLLREQNLTETANRLFGVKVTQLTAAQKAEVVYAEAIRQSANFQQLESQMLKTTAGQWQLLKNRVDAFTLTIGQRLEPVVRSLLNFMSDPLSRLKTFVFDLRDAFSELFSDIVVNAQAALNNLSVMIRAFANEVISLIPFINRPLGTGTRQPFPGFGRSGGAFGGAFSRLFAPGGTVAPQPSQAGAFAIAGRERDAMPRVIQDLTVLQRNEQIRRFLHPRVVQRPREVAELNRQMRELGGSMHDLIPVAGAVVNAFGQIGGAAGNMVSALGGMVLQILQFVQIARTQSLTGIAGVLPGVGIAATVLGTFVGLSRSRAPELQTGGTVAQSGLAVVHQGETITPANQTPMQVTINLDGKQIAQTLVKSPRMTRATR